MEIDWSKPRWPPDQGGRVDSQDVVVGADGEHGHEILSNVEKHPDRGGDRPMHCSYEARQLLTGDLNGYLDAVIAVRRPCAPLLLFGPGEAKGEMHARLIKMKLGAAVASVETEDKITHPQIIAKLRSYIGEKAPRVPGCSHPSESARARHAGCLRDLQASKDRHLQDIESQRKGHGGGERPADQGDRQRLHGDASHREHSGSGNIRA
jgi:hypothetical protein